MTTLARTASARIRVAQSTKYASISSGVMVALSARGRAFFSAGRGYHRVVGWLWIVLLALGVAVVIAAEWPRLQARVGEEARAGRRRRRRKASLRVVDGAADDSDDFAESVRRDLSSLPTTEEREPRA